MNYIKIPRQLIYEKEISDKRILVYSYLYCKRALDDTVGFSISDIVEWSRLNPNYRKEKINDKYIDMLKILSQNNYFEYAPDFENFKRSQSGGEKYRKLKLNIEKFDLVDNFGIIYFDELDKILDFKRELEDLDIPLLRMSSSIILLLLSYLRVNTPNSPSKPLCCYRLNKTISEDTGISEKYIKRIIEILDKLDIIKSQDQKRKKYTKDGKAIYITTPRVFADYRRFKITNGNRIINTEYDYKTEIQNQIKLMNNS